MSREWEWGNRVRYTDLKFKVKETTFSSGCSCLQLATCNSVDPKGWEMEIPLCYRGSCRILHNDMKTLILLITVPSKRVWSSETALPSQCNIGSSHTVFIVRRFH